MKLIIDIPEEAYRARQHWVANPKRIIDEVDIAIANGTPYNPTGDCISREALIKTVEKEEGISWDSHGKDELCVRKKYIDNAPTVKFSLLPADESKDEAYMRGYNHGKIEGVLKANARSQGEWIETQRGIHVTDYKCSCCGRTVRDDTGYDVSKDYPYCHCGADMRKGGAE